MFLINGTWQDSLPANDRAVQFGDGCFTTARVVNGNIQMPEAHLERLRQGCERLAMPQPDWDRLAEEMAKVANAKPLAVLKVILTRGAGGRGYSMAGCKEPSRIISLSAFPEFYSQWQREGIELALSPVRLGRNPALAGIKHLNRLEQVLIRAHLEQTTAHEALVLDSEGWLTECCAANLFWRKGNQVFTPYVDQAGVNGLMRQRILQRLQASRWHAQEVRETVDTLNDADELLICNALLPIAPVRKVADKTYASRELYEFLAPHCE